MESQSKKQPEKPKATCPNCVCHETRRRRDDCLLEKSEESCTEEIKGHKECLREEGF
jgi:cytochrome c oxidase assembly protein subunit 17